MLTLRSSDLRKDDMAGLPGALMFVVGALAAVMFLALVTCVVKLLRRRSTVFVVALK